MTIETKVYTRVELDGMEVECSNAKSKDAVWRICPKKSSGHAPPSFTTGMTVNDLEKMKHLCEYILQQVYDRY